MFHDVIVFPKRVEIFGEIGLRKPEIHGDDLARKEQTDALGRQITALYDEILPVFHAGDDDPFDDPPHFFGNERVGGFRGKAAVRKPADQPHFEMVEAEIGKGIPFQKPLRQKRFARVAFAADQNNHFFPPPVRKQRFPSP